jgi:uncharacterized GH25 family protein
MFINPAQRCCPLRARNLLPGMVTLVLLLLSAFAGSAQTPGKDPTASISGRVTMGGKGVAGLAVVATTSTSPLDNRTVAKTATDEDGKYQLTALAAGQFTIMPLAKGFVVSANGAYRQAGQSITVAEGEVITKIDFALVRGGVVTGRITDADGRPIIAERVNAVPRDTPDAGRPMTMFDGTRNMTDDRGIYRVYGLGPGSYKVSIGQAASAGGVSVMGMGTSPYPKTFYPGVPEEAKATVIEINEGAEVGNIDIVAGKTGKGFAVTGRVIDADSGEPVPNLFVVYSSLSGDQQLGGMNFNANQTDANGKFRLEGVHSGHYAAYTMSAGQETSTYSDQSPFDVTDGDVSGVEIKVRRGGTISGTAVIENNFDPAVAALLQTIPVYAVNTSKGGAPSFSRGQIGPDGSFTITGLAPGKVQVNAGGFPALPKGLTLARTEVDGVEQRGGVEVTAGSTVTGVRLVFAYGAGSIRGEVKVEGGVLPAGLTLHVNIRAVTGGSRVFVAAVDARGHFLAENISPGTYELTVGAFGGTSPFEPVKQTVTVESAQVPVVLVVNLAARKATP